MSHYRRSVAGFLGVAAFFILFLYNIRPELPLFDFSLFWKATNNLVLGHNPYQLPPYSSFSKNGLSHFSQNASPVPSLSPPPALGMFAFIGYLHLDKAKALYLFLYCLSFLWSSWIGYSMFFKKRSLANLLDLLLAFLVLPFVTFFQALAWGSLTVIAVMGICGFFWANARGSDWFAGCCLALCGIKPQLFLLLVVYLIWWAIAKRRYPIIWGAASVYLIGLLISICLQPKIFSMYLAALQGGIGYRVTNASLGSVLYYLSGQQNGFYLYLPIMLGAIFLAFVPRLKSSGNLILFTSIIMPFSLLLSPYCWGHDYIVCFATFFSCAHYIYKSIRKNLYTRTVVLLSCLLGCILLMALTSFSNKAVSFIAFGAGFAFLSVLVLVFTEQDLAKLDQHSQHGRHIYVGNV